MNIYYDTTPTQYFTSDDCKECGVISASFPSWNAMFNTNSQKKTQAIRFQQIPLLYIELWAQEKWLICNPTGQGRIAVLDMDAFKLFEQFREPTTLVQIIATHTDWTAETLTRMTELFHVLGFICDSEYPPVSSTVEAPQTLTAWLHITNACNLGCDYCYIQKSAESMSIDRAYQTVDAVFRSASIHNYKTVYLKYAGGEASLQINTVIALHDYATQLAQQHKIVLQACILSNGVFFSPTMIKALQERHIGVTISLDGIGDNHDNQRPFLNGRGSFKYVDRSIAKLLTHGLVPAISVTVSQRNLAGLPQLIEYILERDLPFSINYYRAHTNSLQIQNLRFEEQAMIAGMRTVFALIAQKLPRRSLLNSLLDKASLSSPHQHTCGTGQNYLVIDQHGGVAKCQADIKRTITTVDVNDPLHVIQTDLTGVQNVSVDEKEGCRNCEWRYWCTGGCPLLTYQATGRSDVRSPNCNIYKALFPEVLRLEALRLLTYEVPQSLKRLEASTASGNEKI
jgi:uncharacterized protein